MPTRFTEQNYPLLKYLHWDKPLTEHPDIIRFATAVALGKKMRPPFLDYLEEEIPSREEQEMRAAILKQWHVMQPEFSANIEILSRNFFLALTKSYEAFGKVEIFKEIEGDFCGTFILPDGNAICYAFEMHDPFLDDEENLCYASSGNIIHFSTDGNSILHVLNVDKAYSALNGLIEPNSQEISGLIDMVIVIHLFKKFAEVQVSDTKSRPAKAPEYRPEVKTSLQGVTFLDASWYTTAIHEGDFTVRGHFRLQPCGPEKKDRRLIFINEFQKHGYVRKAKILTD